MEVKDFVERVFEVLQHLKNEKPEAAEAAVHQLSEDLRKEIQPWQIRDSIHTYPWQKLVIPGQR